VKVPVGKHCGFVQFVRKADAERAIEKMQGFPIGGSRIRLSWGRSQCRFIFFLHLLTLIYDLNVDKAAQAAAQAAHAAALQAHLQSQMISPRGTPITMEQTVQLLQQMQLSGILPPGAGDVQSQQNQTQTQSIASKNDGSPQNVVFSTHNINSASPFGVQPTGGFGGDIHTPRAGISTSFSPFSPDPNLFHGGDLPSGAAPKKPEPILYHPSSTTGFAQGFGSGPALPHDASNTMGANGKVTTPHYAIYHELERTTSTTISRPPSGSLSASDERQEYFDMPEHEHDLIMDLNGTLASLDLDSVNHHQSASPVSRSVPTSWMTPDSSSPSAA
jgi:RNA recognition motif. (a.k.a. RRM, RBD, or RNP domain)